MIPLVAFALVTICAVVVVAAIGGRPSAEFPPREWITQEGEAGEFASVPRHRCPRVRERGSCRECPLVRSCSEVRM
jgi:hypothetical protein